MSIIEDAKYAELAEVIQDLIENCAADTLHVVAIRYLTDEGKEVVLCAGCRDCLEGLLEDFTFENITAGPTTSETVQ